MTINPEVENGFSEAQSLVLSLDYLNQDERIPDEISRFYGINIETIENFNLEFKTYKGLEQKHTERQMSYDKLHTWSQGKGERKPDEGRPYTPDEIILGALRSAGVAVMKSNQALKAEKEKLLEHGTEISITLRDYLTDRLPDLGSLTLNGTTYSLKHEVMTREMKKYTVAFATGEPFSIIARRVYKKQGDNTLACAKFAGLEEWQKLFTDLEQVAKF